MTKRPDKNRTAISFMDNTYLDRTSRPIYALTFLLPLIILYEIGTIFINTGIDHSQIRVVSFVWIQELLALIGFTPKAAWIGAPLVVIIILLATQATSHKKWKVNIPDHFFMAFECILLAVPLIVFSLLLNRPEMKLDIFATRVVAQTTIAAEDIPTVNLTEQPSELEISHRKENLWSIIITGIGAGIYEELIFRMILICLLLIIMQDLLVIKKSHSVIIAVIISSLIFSLHHHIIFINGSFTQGEPFNVLRFSFRVLAGIYFAILYAVRGFGISAGTHAFYDIIIALLNVFVFTG